MMLDVYNKRMDFPVKHHILLSYATPTECPVPTWLSCYRFRRGTKNRASSRSSSLANAGPSPRYLPDALTYTPKSRMKATTTAVVCGPERWLLKFDYAVQS
eukprot:1496770-Rhodomonas_salina.2